MQKILEYNLNVDVNEKFPFMPVLHDCKVNEIRIEDNILIITSNDLQNHDEDSLVFAGFHAKKVQVEFVFEEEIDCMVIVSVSSPKKQIRENHKYGYGKRSNCYDIREFITIYRDYRLEILYNMVSFNQVNLILAGHKNKISEIEMQLFGCQVRYIFTD